jgi:hypothetical protein
MTARRTTFRLHARKGVRLRALLTHIPTGAQTRVEVVDLGLGGAGLVVDEAMTEGDSVSLSFIAPTLWDPLVIRARVAWSSERRAGVAFEHKSPQAVFALFELVNTQ